VTQINTYTSRSVTTFADNKMHGPLHAQCLPPSPSDKHSTVLGSKYR